MRARVDFGNLADWECDCTANDQMPDKTKDPNCHNSNHDHYDPKSPIVLSRKAEYAAEEGFVAREGPADRPGGEFRGDGCICTGPPMQPCGPECNYPYADEPRHECPGCNLRDLTMMQAKQYMDKMLAWMPDNDLRREIAQWLRLTGKIRAVKKED